MDKLFMVILGILIALFGKARIDAYTSKKQAEKATSENLKTKTEAEAVKSSLSVESKLKDVLKEQFSVFNTPFSEAVPSESSKESVSEVSEEKEYDDTILRVHADGQVEEVKVPNTPVIEVSQVKLSENAKEEAMKQLERARRLRNL